MVLGLGMSLFGPALGHLRDRLDQGVGAIGVLFTLQAAGGLVGSAIGGRVFDRIGGHRCLAAGLTLVALGALAVPAVPSLVAVGAAAAVVGAGAGAIDVAANTLVMWSRPIRSGPALNALHLCFGIGALSAPLLVDGSLAWTDDLWPVVAVVAVAAAIVLVLLSRRSAPSRPVDHETGGRPVPPRAALLALAAFFLLYVGAEVAFAGWIYTYAEEIDIGGATVASLLTAGFWTAFTVGRLLAVRVSRTVPPGSLLAGACLLALGGAGLLVLGGGDSTAAWVGTVAYGLGVAPLFATTVALADQHLAMTGRATAWIIGGSSLGALTLPWVVGVLMDRHGADAMPVASLGAMVLVAGAAVVLGRLLRSVERDYRAARRTTAVQEGL